MNRARVAAAMVAMSVLLAPEAASGGGWATVELNPTPSSAAPGEPVDLELTILQHGRTPLEGVRPSVIVSREDGRGAPRTFPATATRRPGVYAARVTFARAGTWRYVVDDGFTARHSYPPVTVERPTTAVAAASGGGGDGPAPWPFAAAVVATGLLVAGLGVRRRRGRPAALGLHGS